MLPQSLCCLVLSCFSYVLLSRDGNVIYLSNGNDFNTVALFSSVYYLPSIYISYNTIVLHHVKSYDAFSLMGYLIAI